MKTLSLSEYGPVITNQDVSNTIYNLIHLNAVAHCLTVEIDFANVRAMNMLAGEQIFGKIYLELGQDTFFERIRLINATNDVKLPIVLGIQIAVEASSMEIADSSSRKAA